LRLWLSPHRPGRRHLPRSPNMATQVPRFCMSAIEIVIGTEIAIGMAAAIEATPMGIDHIIDPTVTISPTAIMGIPTITAGQASASSSDSKWGMLLPSPSRYWSSIGGPGSPPSPKRSHRELPPSYVPDCSEFFSPAFSSGEPDRCLWLLGCDGAGSRIAPSTKGARNGSIQQRH
jgi:hypothetical protein